MEDFGEKRFSKTDANINNYYFVKVALKLGDIEKYILY